MNIGNKIMDLRKEKKWTQEELAKKLFVTDKTISSWESNRTEPSLEMIVKLSRLFECNTNYFINENENKNDTETEIKIKISKDEFISLKCFMDDKATFLKQSKQVDTYYQPTYRKFLKEEKDKIDEWLRIGIRGNKKILNYKKWYKNMYCDEYEVEIDNEINLDKIFTILGLEKIAIVNKTRNTYMYLDKYEVALDIVENLGYFIEIEVKVYDNTATNEYAQLLKVVKDLDLNLENIDKKGYPYHLIYKSQ